MPVLEDELQNGVEERNGRFPLLILSIWQKLTKPATGLSAEDTRQARIIIGLILLFMPFVVIQVSLQLMNQENYTLSGLLSLFFYLGMIMGLYVVSRTKYYEMTAIAICCLTAVYPYSRILVRQNYSDEFIVYSLSWLLISIILATMLLSFKQAITFTFFVVLSIIIIPNLFFDVSARAIIRSVAIVSVSSLLLLLYHYYRTKIDAERIMQLAQANDGLQKSQHTLETRIGELKQTQLELQQSEKELLRSTHQLQTIRQMGLELTSQLDFEPLVQMILIRAAQLVGGDLGVIFTHLPMTQELEIITTNDPQQLPIGATISVDEGVAGYVWSTGELIIVENYLEWDGFSPKWSQIVGARSVIGVPIMWQNKKQGVITIVAPESSKFIQEDAELLTLFAVNAAVALYNANLHKEIQKHTKELERSNRELQAFANAASHDLQEPLRKIRTFSDRLQTRYQDHLDERGKIYLTRMGNAAARMQILIEGLLSFSRVTTKTNSYELIHIRELLHEVIEDLETKIEETKAIITIADKLPTIEADPTQIRQLFQNLISNALKFQQPNATPQITIQARWLPDEVDPYLCEIDVYDNGIGIEPQYKSRIFGMFQRLHSRQQFEGTGLGLAICQRIVERHHGTIRVQSQVGEGSQFSVQLPLKQPS